MSFGIDVSVLPIEREVIAMALLESAHLWIRGALDNEAPELMEGIHVTRYLSSFVTGDSYKYIDRSKVQTVLESLLDKPDISTHFQQVAMERRLFKWAYYLWDMVFGTEMASVSRKLNAYLTSVGMVKYGPFEALGFHYKHSGNYSLIEDGPEHKEWIYALEHNLNNTYMPEKYLNSNMPKLGFIISVISMVANRLATLLNSKEIVCPCEIMAVSLLETDRYSEVDRRDCIRYLLIWARSLDLLLDRRAIVGDRLLDSWEKSTGMKIDRGLNHLVDNHTERPRKEKIVNGIPIRMTIEEMMTGFKLEGGDWVKTWQSYILCRRKEGIYPTWGRETLL